MKKILVLLPMLAAAMSCGKKDEAVVTPATPTTPVTPGTPSTALTYTNSAKAILDAKCISCHASGKEQSGTSMTTFAQASALKARIKVRINDGGDPMPPTRTPPVPQLTSDEKTKLSSWVDAGAPN